MKIITYETKTKLNMVIQTKKENKTREKTARKGQSKKYGLREKIQEQGRRPTLKIFSGPCERCTFFQRQLQMDM
jgi:hypothetical protein